MNTKRKPEWLKVKLPCGNDFKRVKGILSYFRLHSVCQEARCPNIAECFHAGTATFLILGNVCTRNCLYCNVQHGEPAKVDESEPERLVQAIKKLGLNYIVITSVTRDDLPDGGAEVFAHCVETLYQEIPECKAEVLIPDLKGNWQALERIMDARPHVINHNMEIVPALFDVLRPLGNYQRSLELLHRIHQYNQAKIITKSGFMIGFGENWGNILELLHDLASVHCERITVGQYLQPTQNHWPVMKYYEPDEFEVIKGMAYEMGLKHVESGPLVRSSYHAAKMISDPTRVTS
jgi:lipoic acid synthetase